ncbi:MAG: type I restriction endonuclease [Mycobacteriaceae bacterium]|uniref:type I restriction endonuclease n=1 Tax=Corynebacterium sp. TaxID=1720 RepID=UPI003F99EC1D
MSIDQAVNALATKVRELKAIIETEESTKTAFIIPFISSVLGYDVTDPREVIPEYTADVGKKRGEKVDYAIKSGNDFRFLIECKKIGESLDLEHANQLVRYFNVTDTEFAILTNGEVYQFYAQLDAVNRMDERPFMTLDLASVDTRIFPHLEMCTKTQFDSETIAAGAEELKYVSELRKAIANELKEPSSDWVRLLASRVTSRRMTAANIELFTRLTTTASSQYLRDEANRRLRSAQELEDPQPAVTEEEHFTPTSPASDSPSDGVITTEEEKQAHSIIKAIRCSEVPATDITMRDAKSYCAILYQDNNRKPIARLQFDRKTPRIIVFDEDRNESAHDIDDVEGIYAYAGALRDRVKSLQD